MFMVQKAVSKYGEMLIAPVLIIIGIFMLDIIKLNLPKINKMCIRDSLQPDGKPGTKHSQKYGTVKSDTGMGQDVPEKRQGES